MQELEMKMRALGAILQAHTVNVEHLKDKVRHLPVQVRRCRIELQCFRAPAVFARHDGARVTTML